LKKIVSILALVLVAALAWACKSEFGAKRVSPAIGVLAGGEPVEILGSGFDPSMGITVYFGTVKSDNVVVRGSDKLTVTTPSSPEPKAVDVRITTDDGKELLMRNAFTYVEKASMDIRDLGKRRSIRDKD